ncbi:PAAR domain-containing protein [Burkholderia ubonensis]|uniref:PAAR domain-containing protein n=1 Tax=Burkholderia ubonensis TaxID=101571 RepID=UPI001E2D4469|nr:PAAR domain-containing protein [Burkholderia ubonensis]
MLNLAPLSVPVGSALYGQRRYTFTSYENVLQNHINTRLFVVLGGKHMLRRVACVGDRLERGGEILPYSGPVFTFGDAGRQVALIGKTAFCEACKSTGIIAKAGGPKRLNFMGETAADGDIVLCRCVTPPKIVAEHSGESWCDDEVETCGVCDNSVRGIGAFASDSQASTAESNAMEQFDDRFVLRNTVGQPINCAHYAIQRGTGELEYGVTDEQGHTHLLSSTATQENINVYLAG